MKTLHQLLESLGFAINWQKTVNPSQRITFLGIHVDSTTCRLFIPDEKLQETKTFIHDWIGRSKASKRQLQSLIGKIAWAAKCAKPLRPILRSIIDLQAKLKHESCHVRLPAAVKQDLLCFYDWCVHFNGVYFVCLGLCPATQSTPTLHPPGALPFANLTSFIVPGKQISQVLLLN